MKAIRDQAMFCVGRAVFFGYLAISMVMLGSMFDLVLFFRSGAVLCVVMSAILLYFAQTAPARAPERTETWLLLGEEHRPRNPPSKQVFGRLMQEVYGYYARYALGLGLAFALASVAAGMSRYRYIFDN